MRPYLGLSLGVLAVSFAAVFIRLADAPPLVIAAYRLCLASFVIAPAALVRSRKTAVGFSRNWALLALLAGAFLALHFALWITSLDYTTVASSVVLLMANPMFVAVASHWLDGERLTKHLMVGIGLALIGAICIGYGDFALSVRALLGDVLALLSALALGGYMLMGRRLRAQANLLNYLALVYTSAAVILLISATIAGYDFFGYSGTTYIMLVLLAVVPQLIGHSSLNWALRLMPATFVTVAILGEPVGATLLAYLILAEVPTLAEMGGGLLILCAITVAFWQRPEQLTRGSPMR